MAEQQHGAIARRQLLGLGFDAKAIDRRIARGRLFVGPRGVYVVGRPHLTQEGRWMAAVLAGGPGAVVAGGPGAVLSHRSAAALWGFGADPGGCVEISVPASQGCRRPGIRAHRRTNSVLAQAIRHRDIPVTDPVCTLIDLALGLPSIGLERAVNDADKRGLIDPEKLRLALERHPGRPGVARLRKLLDRHTFRLSDSDLEVIFRPLARSAGLPVPLTKQWVNGFEVDFYWPELGLVVETDGLRHHRTPAQQARALLREQAHTAASMTPLRFSHAQVKFDPDYVRANLTKVARLLEDRRGRLDAAR